MNQSEKIISIAIPEIGYLEKRSNSQLDDKTANAGDKNYTKYWRDMCASLQAQPWCACFQVWCARHAGIAASIIPSLYSCSEMKQWAKDRGIWHDRNGATPQPGDLIIYQDTNGHPCHIGLVEKVDSSNVHTIEGNTSSGNDVVVANGGAVARKSYAKTNSRIAGYFRPRYTDVSATADTSPLLVQGSKGEYVGEAQTLLNKHGANPSLAVDNSFGAATSKAVNVFRAANGLIQNGTIDTDLWVRLRAATSDKNPLLQKGSKGDAVLEAQKLLNVHGANPRIAEDGSFGSGTEAAVKAFQTHEHISVDGQIGNTTWSRLREPVAAPPEQHAPPETGKLTETEEAEKWAVDTGLVSNTQNWDSGTTKSVTALLLYRFFNKFLKK